MDLGPPQHGTLFNNSDLEPLSFVTKRTIADVGKTRDQPLRSKISEKNLRKRSILQTCKTKAQNISLAHLASLFCTAFLKLCTVNKAMQLLLRFMF